MGNLRLFFVAVMGLWLNLAMADDDVTEYWQQSNPASQVRVNHQPWGELIARYLTTQDGINLFRYHEVTETDKSSLDAYLDELQTITVTQLNAPEQQAYWINFYNALTVWVILEHYPVDSIFDISFGLFDRGPWKEELVEVEGFKLSLDHIEHSILRPIYNDNRVHYAVNCASIGCPNLQFDVYTRDNLDAMLDRGARQYVNHPRGVLVEGNRLVVSKIYRWYASDFGSDDEQVIAHLSQYAEPQLREALAAITDIDDYEYDWSLNQP